MQVAQSTTPSPAIATKRFSKLIASCAAVCALGLLAFAGSAQAQSGAYTNGSVKAIAYDGSGGFYIGGSFTTVRGSSRSYLAHLNSNATLDTNFTPTLDGPVTALAYSSGKLYVGGAFTTANSTTRNNAAAFDTSGTLDTTWNPNTNNTVADIAIDGTNVYLAGSFTTVRGDAGSAQSRSRVAVVSTSNALGSWAPSVNGPVDEILVLGSNVYFSGNFSNVSFLGATAISRNNIASANTSGVSRTFNPNTNGPVNALATDGTNIYFGGAFTTVGGSTVRNNAASYTTSNGLRSWSPNITSTGTVQVNSMSILGDITNGGNVFIGGAFTQIQGSAGSAKNRNNLAAMSLTTSNTSNGAVVDLNSGAAGSAVNPDPGGSGCSNSCAVNALFAVSGIGLASGGDFLTSASVEQTYYAGPQQSLGTLQVGGTDVDPATPISKGDQIKSVGYGFYDAAGNQTSLYQWQYCSSNLGSSCQNRVGKAVTGAWYGSTNNDVGYRNRARVYWNAITGVIEKFSGLTGINDIVLGQDPVIASEYNGFGQDGSGNKYAAPVKGVSVKPQIGTAASLAKWQGYIAGVSSITSQWQRCSNPLNSATCVDISGAGGTRYWYVPVTADVGSGLRVKMTMTTRSQSKTATSAVTPATVAVATVPGQPTGVDGFAGDGTVDVYWTAPASNGGFAITTYTVTAYDSGSAPAGSCTAYAVTDCTVEGLTNGEEYTFKVVANNRLGGGTASAASPGIVPEGA